MGRRLIKDEIKKKGFNVAIVKLVMTKQKRFNIILNQFFLLESHTMQIKSENTVQEDTHFGTHIKLCFQAWKLKWQRKQTVRKNLQAMLVNFPTIRSFRLCLFHAINKPKKGSQSS